MAAALAINGGVVAALLFAAPTLVPGVAPDDPIDVIFIPRPIASPPPPQPHPTARVTPPLPQPLPTAIPQPNPSLDDLIEPVDTGPGPTLENGAGGLGDSGGGVAVDPPRPTPALVGATFDPRFAADVEPPYPDAARDAGTEGIVKLRLVIGADGRVKRAEPLGGDPLLTRIAIRHVLARWRFRPATRGDVPEESVKVMTVRFRLDR